MSVFPSFAGPVTPATNSPVLGDMSVSSVLSDMYGIALNVGDLVVEAVMTGLGAVCPRLSAKPDSYRIAGIDPESSIVTVLSLESGMSEKFDVSEIAWVG